MKNLSVDELRGLMCDVRNSEEKKTLYIVMGVFVAVFAVAIAIAVVLVKKHKSCFDDEFEDFWDDDEYFDDDFDYEDDENED